VFALPLVSCPADRDRRNICSTRGRRQGARGDNSIAVPRIGDSENGQRRSPLSALRAPRRRGAAKKTSRFCQAAESGDGIHLRRPDSVVAEKPDTVMACSEGPLVTWRRRRAYTSAMVMSAADTNDISVLM
jgi:hypothetical protein